MQTFFDVVIPICNGCSKWYDFELLYMLRSLEQNFTGIGQVFIVGHKPDWIKNVIHIECEDLHIKQKLRNQNILQKVLVAVQDSRLSDNFIFTNDDFFVLQPFTELPNYYEHNLEGYLKANPLCNGVYRRAINRTNEFLLDNGLPTLHYDTHVPIIYNKQKFYNIFKGIDFEIVIKSVYGNSIEGNGVFLPDNKFFQPLTINEIEERNKNQPFFSINDKSLNESMKLYIKNTFKNKSKYE